VSSAAKKPRWEVQRITQTIDHFEGIEARDAAEAIAMFEMGKGELNPERRETPPRTLRAVRVG
jgi:hypothetical protein